MDCLIMKLLSNILFYFLLCFTHQSATAGDSYSNYANRSEFDAVVNKTGREGELLASITSTTLAFSRDEIDSHWPHIIPFGNKLKHIQKSSVVGRKGVGDAPKLSNFGSDTTFETAVGDDLVKADGVIGSSGSYELESISLVPENKKIRMHDKPSSAVDEPDSSASEELGVAGPLIIGIVLLVLVSVSVAVTGYKCLKRVWSTHHYSRMDFLIDGMYDM